MSDYHPVPALTELSIAVGHWANRSGSVEGKDGGFMTANSKGTPAWESGKCVVPALRWGRTWLSLFSQYLFLGFPKHPVKTLSGVRRL